MRGTAQLPKRETEQLLSRRTFVRTASLASALAASGVSSAIWATPALAAPGFVPADLDLHLLRRATYGATKASLDEIRSLGRTAWLDKQLRPSRINDSYSTNLISDRYPNLSRSMADIWAEQTFDWITMFELGQAAIARATWSKRQLFEVMVDFWSNHLNVTNPFDGGWHCRHDYDKKVIRKHALGRFVDMLVASATHPAMMLYLNNAESTKDNPNENYGREILELHSVGVDAGYDENDMRQSTLVLTGFGFDWNTGLFSYYGSNHHVGPVQVMGWSHTNGSANGGYDVGLSYVRYLARHPATAHRIAYKLCQRFVSDVPPAGLVNSLANTYLANDTAIVPVLRKLFGSTAFKNSLGDKVRRPTEDVVATLRILGIKPDAGTGTDGIQGLYWMLEGLGNLPMSWGPPDGYPDVASAWAAAGGLLGRWNTHISLAAHWWPDELRQPPLENLLPSPLPPTHGPLINALAKKLVFRKLSTAHRDAVLGFLGETASSPLDANDAAVTWRLPYVVALILDSPYHEIR